MSAVVDPTLMDGKSRKKPHRVARTIRYLFFSYPHFIVTVPLASWLMWQLIRAGFLTPESWSKWTLQQAIGSGACIALVSLFSLLAVGNLVVTIMRGWRGTRGGNGGPSD